MPLCIGATFTACSLDVEPETSLTDAGYWKSAKDLRGACNYLYSLTSGEFGGFYHDYRSDELRGTSDNTQSTGNWLVPNSSSQWSTPYKAIAAANNIIEKADRASLTQDEINKYLAEAYFFRSYYYFHLLKRYGDVPLLLSMPKATDDPVLMTPRTPRQQVIDQCYKDMQFAAANLPDIDKQTWGFVSRSAALGMLVRMGLYNGTYAKYHATGTDYKSDLRIAVDAAEKMIAENKHALYSDFQKLFLFDGEGRQNKENVMVNVYGPNGEGTTVHDNSRQLENAATLTRKMVDLFLYSDGLPKEKSPLYLAKETSYNDVFLNRDPRLTMTCYQAGEDAYKGALTAFGFRYGYNIKKGFSLKEWETNSKETVDKAIIRYAEVLISYAEALYELNGNITDAQLDASLNKLRSRAHMPALTLAFASANGLDLLTEIRRERTVEFIDEGMRYDDIIRWKTAEREMPDYMLGARLAEADVTAGLIDQLKDRITLNGGYFKGEKISDQDSIYILELRQDRKFDPAKDYLYPVPLQEISRTGGIVTQNPKW